MLIISCWRIIHIVLKMMKIWIICNIIWNSGTPAYTAQFFSEFKGLPHLVLRTLGRRNSNIDWQILTRSEWGWMCDLNECGQPYVWGGRSQWMNVQSYVCGVGKVVLCFRTLRLDFRTTPGVWKDYTSEAAAIYIDIYISICGGGARHSPPEVLDGWTDR